ncbi:MAG: SGNH/GDSL hydrolase family protein, partial [Caldilineaceae bacterium]
MTTNYHTPLNTSSPVLATGALFNTVFAALDGELTNLNTQVDVSLDADGTLKANAVDNTASLANGIVTAAKMAATLESINLTPRYMSRSKHAWRNVAGTVKEIFYDTSFPEGALYLPAGESIIYYVLVGQIGQIGDAIYLECDYKAVSGGTLVLAITQRDEAFVSVSNVLTNNTATTKTRASTSSTLVTDCVYVAVTLTASTQAITLSNIRFGKNGSSKASWIDDPRSPDPAKYLPITAAKLRAKQDVTFMFRGTSITAGAVVGGSSADRWTSQLCSYIATNFGVTVTEINLGASSCDQWYDATWNRITNGFVAPDAIFIEVSHNNGQEPGAEDEYLYCLDGQIQSTLQMYPNADIILTVMNPHMTSATADANTYKMAAARAFGQRYGLYVIDAMEQILKLYATGFDITLLSEATAGGTDHHPNLLGNDFIEYVARQAFRLGNSLSGVAQGRHGAALGGATAAYKYMRFFESDETDFFVYTGAWSTGAYTLSGANEPGVITYSTATGADVTFSWWGYGYYLLPDKGNWCGISDIT